MKKVIIVLPTILFVLFIFKVVMPMAREKSAETYSTMKADPFVSELADDFRNKTWQHDNLPQSSGPLRSYPNHRSVEQPSPNIKDLGADIGKQIDEVLIDAQLGGLDKGEDILKALSLTLNVDSDYLRLMYNLALNSTDEASFLQHYPPNQQVMAYQFYSRLALITTLLNQN
jgi:hypothetical protein